MSFSDFLKGQVFLLIQWLYVIWQIARDTTFVNAIYYLCQMTLNGQLNFVFRRNTNIDEDHYGVPFTRLEGGTRHPDVLHISKKYSLGRYYIPSWEDFRKEYFDNASNRNMNGVELIDFNTYWYTVKFNGSYYFCHQDILFEWALYDIHDKVILLKDVQLIGNELVMGTVISKEEMFETMLSKEYHINDLYAPCIFGKQYNAPWNLRLSAFLATIPVLLQAKGLANESALCTLILIVVDIVRTPLLHLYELFMVYLTKAVKLWIFRKCKSLYIFFSWFSKRWAACDRRYGYAYYTTAENEKRVFPVTTFVKFKNLDDCKFVRVVRRAMPCIESYGFQINNGLIHSAELSYGEYCLYVEVKEGFFVSSVDAPTILKYNYYSIFEPDMELAQILKSKCNMLEIVTRGMAKIRKIEILKRGVATVRKILVFSMNMDNFWETAGNIDMKVEIPNRGGESDIVDKWRKTLQWTPALLDITKDFILKSGVATHGKILDQQHVERKLENLLQTAGNIEIKEELPNRGGESDIMDKWRKRLQGTPALVNITKDVVVVLVLQGECRMRKPLRHVVPLFEKHGDVDAALATAFSMKWYGKRLYGKQEVVMIRYFSGVGKEAGRLSVTWQLYRYQEHLIKVAQEFGIKLTTFYGRGESVEGGGNSTQLARNRCLKPLQLLAVAATLEIWNASSITLEIWNASSIT